MNRDLSLAKLRSLVAQQHLVEAREFGIDLTQRYTQDSEIWMLRSGIHYRLGELDAVVKCCQRVIAYDPANAGAHCSLGLASEGLKRLAEAEAAYREALRIDPRYMRALAQLTGLLRAQKRFGELHHALDNALAHSPQDAFLHYNLGLSFVELGQRQKALDSFRAAVARNPRFAEAHHNLGVLYDEFDDYPASITHLEQAVALNPNYVDAHRALGGAMLRMGRPADAIAAYDRTIAVAPDDAGAHCSRAICYLLLGDFGHGWPEYEWRLRHRDTAMPLTGRPRWRGEPLTGKTLALLGEQGMGDTVQFVRYARAVKALGARVLLVCSPALKRLFNGCDGVDAIFNKDDVPPYDFDIPLLSLPGVFGTRLETIPADVPYLRVPPGAGAEAVAEIARHSGALRVGLVWAGGKHYSNDRRRSCGLSPLRELLAVRGVTFFSLQKGDPTAELSALPQGPVVDLDPLIEDFADTAAAIQALDLVVSVDTAVAHLAGALGRQVWTLLPFWPDWRWLLKRDDSPWYPSMRLFRQPAPGEWSSVIARVAAQLTALVQEQSATGKDRKY